MSWGADVNAVRVWLLDTLADRYPTVVVSSEPAPVATGAPFARVRQIDLQFEPETPISDRLTARFELAVRLDAGASAPADFLTLEAEALRSELTDSALVGLDSPLVERVLIEQSESASGMVEFALVFSCAITAERGSGG